MSIDTILEDYWGVVIVLGGIVFWWVGRPIWNVLFSILRGFGRILREYILRPLNRAMRFLFRHLIRTIVRLAPILLALLGASYVASPYFVIEATMTSNMIGQELSNLVVNGIIVVVGYVLLTIFIWRYYATHAGTGFGGVEELVSDTVEDAAEDAVDDTDDFGDIDVFGSGKPHRSAKNHANMEYDKPHGQIFK